MEGFKHFSHPHDLKFHKSLEGAQLNCTGCNFPCTGTPVYSCRACKYFLHEQCFNASRSLAHPLHPDHPISLFPVATHASGSFQCDLCQKTGTGFCFSCAECGFDLHVHCAIPFPNGIKLKSHPAHALHYLSKSPYGADRSCSCDVCGTNCDENTGVYHCQCKYDAHVECVNLPETVKREDHKHVLALLHVNPYTDYECDVCRCTIVQSNCMYECKPCNYGTHVKCVTANSEKHSRRVCAICVTKFLKASKYIARNIFGVLKFIYNQSVGNMCYLANSYSF
ncbi:zinc finger, PHD-type, DC1, Zinc finger, RING/FYVE/PHD-type [Artemisia annua]|uniref:Zinc finger, PHD-type, DC1, Zinc finger, RING/FYVE/PHD-type n=1 Tax=Artemisia annua TaxID=35608 RepID=A0A2U1MG10_ARTAN|nr:zinc finger, PHD-type, DC1, Zinc finger, RING/FYVE/PHD-type [Artemisia annua]